MCGDIGRGENKKSEAEDETEKERDFTSYNESLEGTAGKARVILKT